MRALISSLMLMMSLQANATEVLHPKQVEQLFAEGPRLVVLWSVDCPPCYKELAMLEQLLKTQQHLAITVISTDDDASRYPEVETMHQRLQGGKLRKWVFAEFAAPQLRFAIDPSWSGVLPRSYFINPQGQRRGHSGLLKTVQIMDWFDGTQ
jgi:thiol-disulfide isomerase/thioredoxin